MKTNLRGSNQHVAKKGIRLHEETQRSMWQVMAIGIFLILLAEKTQPQTVSPCPDGGCAVSKVFAQETEARIELKNRIAQENKPTKTNIIAYIAKVFEPEGTAVQVRAIRCFYSESGLRTEAYNYNTNGTEDRGVAQINSIHGMKTSDAHNFKMNINKAYQIYKGRGSNFSAWYGKDCN